jgi:hypothetical protein
MKRITLFLAAAMMVSMSLSAQEFKPAVKAGAKSLNFTFGGFGAFGIAGSGISGGLGMSYFASQDVAYRLGVQAVYNSATVPWNDNTNPGSDQKSTSTGIGAGFDYLMYMNSITSRVRPYYGAGVNVYYHTSDVKYAVPNNAGTGSQLELKNGGSDGLTFGIAGILGAEFFLYPELSLSAEYELNVLSVTSNSDRVLTRKNLADATTKGGSSLQILGFGAAGATLHIYF